MYVYIYVCVCIYIYFLEITISHPNCFKYLTFFVLFFVGKTKQNTKKFLLLPTHSQQAKLYLKLTSYPNVLACLLAFTVTSAVPGTEVPQDTTLKTQNSLNLRCDQHLVVDMTNKEPSHPVWVQWQILFSWAPKSLQIVTAAVKLKDTCSLKEKLWQT